MGYTQMGDVVAACEHLDDEDVLERSQSDQALRVALEMCRPPNWWGTGAGEQLLVAARQDGLPLVWVPRPEIVRELAASADETERLQVLDTHVGEIIEDCTSTLGECSHKWLVQDVELAMKAVTAYEAGHPEAAMALAVSMGEPLAAWASTPRVTSFDSRAEHEAWTKERGRARKYKWAEIEIDRAGPDFAKPWDFVYQALIAPIPRFFTPWHPGDGTPRPRALSRHVVAHQPALDHFTSTNALLSIMLITSILRTQQEWSEEVDDQD